MARYVNSLTAAEIISEHTNIPLHELVDIMAEVPSEDVAPVRHGHWIAMGDCGVTRCSCCGWSFEECIEDKYCRGCGAKMDETS